MPTKGNVWRHVIISTHCTWLPGSKKGWRSRKHKRHSSGDYKNPPPPNEHDGLLEYSQSISGDPVTIPWSVRPRLLLALAKQFEKRGYRVLVATVSGQHAHLLVELPINLTETKRIVGLCKGASSHRVRERLPGKIWAASGKFKIVATQSHQRNAFKYIKDEQGPGAFIWSFELGLERPKPFPEKRLSKYRY